MPHVDVEYLGPVPQTCTPHTKVDYRQRLNYLCLLLDRLSLLTMSGSAQTELTRCIQSLPWGETSEATGFIGGVLLAEPCSCTNVCALSYD